MLDPKYLNAVVELNQSLAEENKFLAAVGETPLAMLVRSTPSLGLADSVDYTTAIEQLSQLSRTNEHAEMVSHTRQLSAVSVRETLIFSRGVVWPHINRVVEDYQKQLSSHRAAGPAFNTELVYQSDLYGTSIAMDLVAKWRNVPLVEEPKDFFFGRFDAQEILDKIKVTETEEFDTLMREELTADNGKGLEQVIKLLAGEHRVSHLDARFALAAMLFIGAAEIPAEGVKSTLDEYNLNRSALANAAGHKALRVINGVADNLQDNILYATGITSGSNVIRLNGEVFKRLCEQGVTIEMIIGNELLGRPNYAKQLLEPEVQQRVQKVYEDDLARRQEAHSLSLAAVSRKSIMNALRNDQQAIAAAGNFPVEGDTPEKSWARLKSCVDSIYENASFDPDAEAVIAATICGVWYCHTQVWRIIDIMMSIGKNNPTISPESLATLTTVRYIAEWVASMISVGGAAFDATADAA